MASENDAIPADDTLTQAQPETPVAEPTTETAPAAPRRRARRATSSEGKASTRGRSDVIAEAEAAARALGAEGEAESDALPPATPAGYEVFETETETADEPTLPYVSGREAFEDLGVSGEEPESGVAHNEQVRDGGEAAAAPVPSFGLLFQPPDPAAAVTSRRRRRAERGVQSTDGFREDSDGGEDSFDDAPDHFADDGDTDDETQDDAAETDEQDSADESATRGSRRSRRGRRGGRGGRVRNDREGDDGTSDEQRSTQPVEAERNDKSPDADDGDTDDETQDDESGDDRGRRRRRGGRGRRRPGDDSASEESDDEAVSEGDDEDSPNEGDDQSEAGGTRRRTRRRRRAGSGTDTAEDPPGTTTRVRESRTVRDEATGIKGSTRLEAKRQRRRDGREAGRRRTIITEAQFLARRESVERVMAIREIEGRTEIGVLEDGVLVEHYLSGADGSSGGSGGATSVGNVYLGRVQNVLPSMEAAFVDIGKNRNGVLYAGEVNWDAAGLGGGSQRRIEHALSAGQNVLVQATKDPIGHKGARLTSQVSLPGRFLVYVPDGSMTGISRKLPDTERSRLKSLLKKIVPADAGVIVRTAAEGASEEELRADVERLERQWQSISKKASSGNGPVLLHGEPGLTVRVVRDVFNEDFSKLVVAGRGAWNTVSEYVDSVAPELRDRVEQWTGTVDLFTTYRIDEQLAKAMDRKVWLPSGGSLVIDRTEAMTVVDVNTGKFTGSGGNLEETVTKNNLEAAEEIVNQLRLRDIGGIIVVDFIDMVLEANRELVVRRLVECLGRDRTKHQVAEVTSLGLVQMTRKRVGAGLIEVFSEPCEHCHGRGLIVRDTPNLPTVEPETEGRPRRDKERTRSRKHDRAAHKHDSVPEQQPEQQEESGEDSPRKAVSAAAMAKVAAALKAVPEDVVPEVAAQVVDKVTEVAEQVVEPVVEAASSVAEVVSGKAVSGRARPGGSAESAGSGESSDTSAPDPGEPPVEAPARRPRRAGRRAATAPPGANSLEGVGLMTGDSAPAGESAPLTSVAGGAAEVGDAASAVVSGTGDEAEVGSTTSRRKQRRRKQRRRAGAPAGPPTDA